MRGTSHVFRGRRGGRDNPLVAFFSFFLFFLRDVMRGSNTAEPCHVYISSCFPLPLRTYLVAPSALSPLAGGSARPGLLPPVPRNLLAGLGGGSALGGGRPLCAVLLPHG